ncbi:metallopeptidase family protein [Streptomyces sp. NPDC057702]
MPAPGGEPATGSRAAFRDAVRDEVAVTVVHEVAHHFGIEDERLHELGWG